MRLVLSWLREFVEAPESAAAIADALAMRGFEVASIENLGGGDAVIDFEVTANRPDCLSVVGLAREVATVYDRPLRVPGSGGDSVAPAAAGVSPHVRVTIEDAELCPRYAAAAADVQIRS